MRVFKITGILIIISSLISIFVVNSIAVGFGSLERAIAMFSIAISIVLGAAVYSVGDLLNRVGYLERKLKLNAKNEPVPSKSDKAAEKKHNSFKLPQKKCPECGDIHDFDYLTCPKCKHTY